jgi:hypothetical protein
MSETGASCLIVATLLLVTAPAAAQTAPSPKPPQPGWLADAKGCQIWNERPKPNQSVTWSGACQNRIAQGRGVVQWFENDHPADRYEGELVAGKLDGSGAYISADGFRYDGAWRDGKANGTGELTTKSGTFNGTWIDGCFRDGKRRAWVGVAASSCP